MFLLFYIVQAINFKIENIHPIFNGFDIKIILSSLEYRKEIKIIPNLSKQVIPSDLGIVNVTLFLDSKLSKNTNFFDTSDKKDVCFKFTESKIPLNSDKIRLIDC